MNFEDSSDEENFDLDQLDKIVEERDFAEERNAIVKNLLPNKSRVLYEYAYSRFLQWKDNNKVSKINEDILIVYFEELSDLWKSPTLWSHWSKLAVILGVRHNIDMQKFTLLKTFLKRKSKGYKPKKALDFTWAQVKKFIETAPDYNYLAAKVYLLYFIITIRY